MSFDTWLLFVALSVLPAFSPGPSLLLTLSNSLRYGSRITVWSALGNTLGMTIIGTGVTFGLGALMATSSGAFFVLKIIGGIYLVWLGIKTWRDRSSLEADMSLALIPKRRSIFLTALGVAVTNPKAIAVQLAIIPPFLSDPATLHRDGILLAISYAMMCLVSHLSVMILSGRIRGFFADALRMKYLRRGIGLTFIGFGAALAAATR
ncbi:LysE family transporter [uncultured Cohaesibacter sp.]|uniref:LysE family translocator n=1 Tax=uncultured Cohaesibacter sp. TaxID=1002546 RepID=UPI0029C9905C|nr:LysE family transporter [uncultured Cohaesibacter sp.]